MEITLEKIELVKDRTGVTYAEAKEALEEAEGSVVDAIIAIEETVNAGKKERGFGEKDLIKKGNVARIQVKREDEMILNVPLNAGIVGICIAPLASIVAVAAAFGFTCKIEVVKTDGTIIDVSDTVTETVSTAIEKGSDVAEKARERGAELYEKGKVKGGEYYEQGKKMADEYSEKFKESEIYDKAKDAAEDLKEKADDLVDKAKDAVDKATSRAGEAEESFDVEAEGELEDIEDMAEEVKEAEAEVEEAAEEAAEEAVEDDKE